jgi:hypothetical protein
MRNKLLTSHVTDVCILFSNLVIFWKRIPKITQITRQIQGQVELSGLAIDVVRPARYPCSQPLSLSQSACRRTEVCVWDGRISRSGN